MVYLEKANILPVAYKMANFLAFSRSTGRYNADNENIKQLIATQHMKPNIRCVLLYKTNPMRRLKRRRTGHKYHKNDFSSNKTYVLPGTENWNKSSATGLTSFRSVLPVRCSAAFWTPSVFARARCWVYSFALYSGIRRVPISNWPSRIHVVRQPAHTGHSRAIENARQLVLFKRPRVKWTRKIITEFEWNSQAAHECF